MYSNPYSDSVNPKQPPFKRNFNSKNHSLDKNKTLNIDFVLVGANEVGVSMPYSLYDSKKKQIIKVTILLRRIAVAAGMIPINCGS